MNSEACAHCALPLGRRPLRTLIEGVPAAFCCTGCLLARQVTRETGEAGALGRESIRLGLAIFFTINLMMVGMSVYVPAVYGAEVDGPMFGILRWLTMALSAPVVGLLGAPLWRSWQLHNGATDALIALGATAAWGTSVANTVRGDPAVYFDTVAMLLVLTTLGRLLEAQARVRAGASIRRTFPPVPTTARRVIDDRSERVAVDTLAPGDLVDLAPGEAFPTDGVVVRGLGGVDESALTGEGAAVVREAGMPVSGGTTSLDGWFRVRVTAPASESATARIAALTAAAAASRSQVERLADRLAGAIAPLVILVAIAAGGWWTVHDGLARGVLVALAVLVVACPCGLGIAVPAAMAIALSRLAAAGTIVRGAEVLERLWGARTILFDKTGTLTDVPDVRAIDSPPGVPPDEVLRAAAALEALVPHPLARAIVAASTRLGLPTPAVDDRRLRPGLGVTGTIQGTRFGIGSRRFAREDASYVVPATRRPETPVLLLRDGRWHGTIWVREQLFPSVIPAVAQLRAAGFGVGVLTGDPVTDAVTPVPFAAGEVNAGLTADAKVALLRSRRHEGAVVMVGDGQNDAPALAAADVGIAVGAPSDLTRSTADILVCGRDGIARIPALLADAAKVRRIVLGNLLWAFGYNAVAVGLAATGRLNPLVAAIAMIGSSVVVLANAQRAGTGRPLATDTRRGAGHPAPAVPGRVGPATIG